MKHYVPWLLAILVVASGCLEPTSPQALHIEANVYVGSRTQCQVRPGGRQFRSRGIMDIALTNTYYFYPSIRNNLPESGAPLNLDERDLRLNNHDLTLMGASVRFDYDVFDDLAFEVDFERFQGAFSHASGSVFPQDVTVTTVPIIPWELGNQLARAESLRPLGGAGTLINVRVTIHAKMADNTVVKSNEFWYPIVVCNGCLVYFPPEVNPRVLLENLTVPCAPGQDDGVDTRFCYAYAGGEIGEELFRARDRCRWQHILNGIEPPDSQYYWDRYKDLFPQYSGPGGLR